MDENMNEPSKSPYVSDDNIERLEQDLLATRKLYETLLPLDTEQRIRVMRATATLLGVDLGDRILL